MDIPVPEGAEDLEITLNSVPISFPSGEKIDNISSVTEVSDSDFEILKQDLKILTNASKDRERSDGLPLNKQNFHSRNCHLPSPVKETLKANADLLVDKNILNHLLEPENINENPNLPEPLKNNSNMNCVNSIFNKPDENIYNNNVNRYTYHYEKEKEKGEETSVPYLSVNSTPKKSFKSAISHYSMPTSDRIPLVSSEESKRVNFAPEVYESARGFTVKDNIKSNKGYYSFTSFGPEIVFDKLGEIRHHLDLKEGNEEANLSDLPLTRFLAAKLNSQKQRTKDLEEELTLNEASLTKITCELEVVQKRLQRREEQLKEAGEQIGKLQTEWQKIQQKLLSSRDSYRSENENMKREIQILKQEKEATERDLRIFREEQKQFSELKVNAAEMKFEVEKSSKKTDEVLHENLRLNKQLKMVVEKLEHYEKELLPNLEGEMKKLEEENESLHSKLDNLTRLKNNVDEELKVLKQRHSAVLVKAVEDEELKITAIQEKEISLEIVEKLKNDKSSMMGELHQEYQDQLQAILHKKITEFGVHFDAKEKKMRENFNEQIQDLKKSFSSEREGLKNRNLEEQELLKKKFERENFQKDSTIRKLKNENNHFRTQIEVIMNAISSVVPKNKDGGSASQKNVSATENLRFVTGHSRLRPSELRNEIHLSHFGDLGNMRNETSSGNEHQHKKSNHAQEFPVPPLITSTSLSCSDLATSESEISSKGRKLYHRGKTKGKTSAPSQKPKFGLKGKLNGRKVVPAAQLIGSAESASSDKSCNSKFFTEVDKEMADLVLEINSMSQIMAPQCANDTPRHDTSLDLDPTELAIKKIDIVSEKLSKYMTGP